jgi:hypothetical protein
MVFYKYILGALSLELSAQYEKPKPAFTLTLLIFEVGHNPSVINNCG